MWASRGEERGWLARAAHQVPRTRLAELRDSPTLNMATAARKLFQVDASSIAARAQVNTAQGGVPRHALCTLSAAAVAHREEGCSDACGVAHPRCAVGRHRMAAASRRPASGK